MDQKRERNRQRSSLLLVGTLRLSEGAAEEFKIRNLSATGLMGEMDAPPGCGETVSVEVGQLGPLAATVVWLRQRRFGLEFESEIDPASAYRPVGRSPQPFKPSPSADLKKRLI